MKAWIIAAIVALISVMAAYAASCSPYTWNEKAARCIEKKTGQFVPDANCKK